MAWFGFSGKDVEEYLKLHPELKCISMARKESWGRDESKDGDGDKDDPGNEEEEIEGSDYEEEEKT